MGLVLILTTLSHCVIVCKNVHVFEIRFHPSKFTNKKRNRESGGCILATCTCVNASGIQGYFVGTRGHDIGHNRSRFFHYHHQFAFLAVSVLCMVSVPILPDCHLLIDSGPESGIQLGQLLQQPLLCGLGPLDIPLPEQFHLQSNSIH